MRGPQHPPAGEDGDLRSREGERDSPAATAPDHHGGAQGLGVDEVDIPRIIHWSLPNDPQGCGHLTIVTASMTLLAAGRFEQRCQGCLSKRNLFKSFKSFQLWICCKSYLRWERHISHVFIDVTARMSGPCEIHRKDLGGHPN